MTSTTSFEPGPLGTTFLLRRWQNDDADVTLLLVHGLYEHSGRWDHVGTYFQERGYDVHMYDLRDHGQTSGPPMDVAPFQLHVDDLEWRIEALRSEARPLVVYSHSVGGLISAVYAAGDRLQPDAWVWTAPALGSTTSRILIGAVKGLARVAPGFTLADAPKRGVLSSDPAVEEAYFNDPLVRFKGTARAGVALLGAMDEAKAHRFDIETPALTMHGTDDGLIPPQASAPLAEVPSVERKVWPGLRHELHNEPSHEDVLGFADRWFRSQLGK